MPNHDGKDEPLPLPSLIQDRFLQDMRAQLEKTQEAHKVIRPILEGMMELMRYDEKAISDLIHKLEAPKNTGEQ
jgi:hypothetical protein